MCSWQRCALKVGAGLLHEQWLEWAQGCGAAVRSTALSGAPACSRLHGGAALVPSFAGPPCSTAHCICHPTCAAIPAAPPVCRSIGAGLRCNLVIALGDLALRWPNLLEPWTEHMYRPLADDDVAVGVWACWLAG